METISNVFLILSGKGGVGKSSVTSQLAITLANHQKKVGILDIDLTGPSIPRIFGLQDHKVLSSPSGKWLPVNVPLEQTDASSGSLCIMSLAFLLPDKDAAVIWRGPKKTAMIQQFIRDVDWGHLDYLLIDTPPGTSDEHISIIEFLAHLQPKAIMVTTPQAVSIADVRKEVNFCQKVGVEIVGVVENMSGFVCPHCSVSSFFFSSLFTIFFLGMYSYFL
jgi:Mrp family chromosome partitioning ATPase